MTSSAEFSDLADQLLSTIYDAIEKYDKHGRIDIDMRDGILNLTTQDGVYVINKHSAAREVWLSSPISGPFHFFIVEDKWISKGGDNLMNILSSELDMDLANLDI